MLSVLSVIDARRLRQLAAAGAAGLHHLLLCRRLHDVAEALDAAEHRHRRRRRRLPPMIGWAAATGSISARERHPLPDHLPVDPAALLGAGAVRREDYASAGVPMMPNVAGRGFDPPPDLRLFGASPSRSWACCPSISASPAPAYGVAALGLGLGFLGIALKGADDRPRTAQMAPAKAMFALFAALPVRHIRRSTSSTGSSQRIGRDAELRA